MLEWVGASLAWREGENVRDQSIGKCKGKGKGKEVFTMGEWNAAPHTPAQYVIPRLLLRLTLSNSATMG